MGKEPPATDPAKIKTPKGFKVELLHSVPAAMEGSWVNLCADLKGRLIVSDQYGSLYRVTPSPVGNSKIPTKVEKIPADIGEAQGLLWAFDSLYVVVNKGGKYDHGFYRVRDTNGDDQLDEVTQLQKFTAGGEHGPHAVLLAPDGKNLIVVIGNQTKRVDYKTTRVPPRWGEDHLLPRMPDGRGFMAGVLGPGGTIYKVDPDGKNWEILGVGFRNEFDAAFNRQGELFTYDADMEWDFNTPWYRPTRVCHVTSGAEFGWRNGAGKWPSYYPDSLPGVVDIGPGSPTGVSFGYGAKFPAKYQNAFFICDWSYGKMYATHLIPTGSTYKAEVEEFVSGSPLPLTDVIINPTDGAMYFTIGGRKTKSGLYRVTYQGEESTGPSRPDTRGEEDRAVRKRLESFHAPGKPEAVAIAWPQLGSPDRFIRFAARVALEHQDPSLWQDKALGEKDPRKAIYALLGLIRATASDPQHQIQEVNQELKGKILSALLALDFSKLGDEDQLDYLRTLSIAFVRMGAPEEKDGLALAKKLDAALPGKNKTVNSDILQVLVYLQYPSAAAKGIALLGLAATQEDQMEVARALRMLRAGWTAPLKKEYFSWFNKATGYKGGMSFTNFIENIKRDGLAMLMDHDKAELKEILEFKPVATATALPAVKRDFVKQWKMDDLVGKLESGLKKGRNFEKGQRLFAEARCIACHRYGNDGGALGPDLTGVAGRFSPRDLLESTLDPNKVISDQYAGVVIATDDGKLVAGRIINLSGNNIMVNTDMFNPAAVTNVDHRKVESINISKVSMMPAGLADTLKEEEILDLLAFMLSRGDNKSPMFAK